MVNCSDVGDYEASFGLSALVRHENGSDRIGRTARKVLLQLLGGSRTAHYLTYQAYVADAAVDWHVVEAEFAESLADLEIDAPAVTDRAKSRFICEAIQKQANLEAVISLAYRILEEGRATAQGEYHIQEPGQDWLNSLTREAEYAFSETVRERLAKVLCAELQAAGTFSRSTIRIVADIDDALLDRFFEVVAVRFGDAIPAEPAWSWGAMFDLGLALENALLISGVRGQTHKHVHMNDQGLGFMLAGADALTLRGPPESLVQIPVWMITPIGQQISMLRPLSKNNDALRRVAALIDKKDVETIHLGQIVEGGERVTLGEQLWPA